MLTEEQIIEGCKNFQRNAQKDLYKKYAPVLRGICYRYMQSKFDAEDVLHESFIKIFKSIKQYSGKGSFEGWLKRIVTNTAIDTCKKRIRQDSFEDLTSFKITMDDDDENENGNYDFHENEVSGDSDIKMIILNSNVSSDEIMEVVQQLPDGYRMVFNLHVIEEYQHKEIANMLGVDVNTSKSQLSRAKKLLQKKLYELAKMKLKNRKGDFK